jgi:hypothetical protein
MMTQKGKMIAVSKKKSAKARKIMISTDSKYIEITCWVG